MPRRFFCLSVVVVWAFCFSSRSARAGLPRPYGGELRLDARQPLQLDPAQATDFFHLMLARQVHETLLRASPDGSLKPALLVRQPEISEEGREFVLEFLPGLTDHKGYSLDAQDLVQSWQRLLSASTASPHWWLLAPVEGALDYRRGAASGVSGLLLEHRLRLRVRLRCALPGFLQALAALPTAPLSLGARSAPAIAVGAGPFFWRKSQSQDSLEQFVPHPWGRPFLDRIVLVGFSSPREASMAMEAGRLELMLAWPKTNSAAASLSASPQQWSVFLALNRQRLSFLPAGWREAIEAAIDRQALARYAGGADASPLWGLLADSPPPSDETARRAQARAYLEKVTVASRGVAPVLTFLVHRGDEMERLTAERIQVDLMALGLVVSLVELDEQAYAERSKNGDFHLSLARPFLPLKDDSLRLLGLAAALAGGEAEANQVVAELLQRLEKLAEPSCGDTLVQELARSYQQRLPAVPLFVHSWKLRVAPAVQEVVWEMQGLPDLAGCWLLPGRK